MAEKDTRAPARGGPGSENRTVGQPAENDHCRCKETSQMTPRELIRLMFNDLSFWKKEKK